ncbi:MAG: protocatechuate 3,4-dioxygenase [Acidobacteriota bacterium]|nr:protocatechuate 3,4-dioxygenase [Acidobacteriota bacterium]
MVGGFGALTLTGTAFAQEAARVFTPGMDLGPFYPLLKPLDEDADLTVIAGKGARAEGQIVHVAGRVLNLKGEPVSGARIEIWQANAHGRYSHPSDPNTAPLDPNFQGSAVLKTDAEGRYRFKTIKPGSYPISPTERRTPHIHFEVTGEDNRLATQMFFPGEPLNAKDSILQSLPFEKSALVARQLPPTKEIAPDELLLGWDIVLING